MKNTQLLLLFFGFVLALNSGAESVGYFDDRERGWFWYEEPPKEEEKKKEDEKPTPAPSVAQPFTLSPREQLKKQGEDWENAMAEAILNPSKENYLKYLAMTAKIQQQSQNFATGYKQAIWVTPEYDYTLVKPRATQAIVAQNQYEVENNNNQLKSISKENGLIFFFRSDCPFCHRFAPVLKKFASQFGFTVIPVSLDGKGLDQYPYPKRNYDIGKKLNVSVVPALFMVNPESNSVSTVGYGYSDYTKLTQKVLFAAKQMNEPSQIARGN